MNSELMGHKTNAICSSYLTLVSFLAHPLTLTRLCGHFFRLSCLIFSGKCSTISGIRCQTNPTTHQWVFPYFFCSPTGIILLFAHKSYVSDDISCCPGFAALWKILWHFITKSWKSFGFCYLSLSSQITLFPICYYYYYYLIVNNLPDLDSTPR